MFNIREVQVMDRQLELVKSYVENDNKDNKMDVIELYEGIVLSYVSVKSEELCIQHAALDNVIEINYCKEGKIGWKMSNGNKIFLAQGDFSVHTMKSCVESEVEFPTGEYEGLKICIDIDKVKKNTPDVLKDLEVSIEEIYKKHCEDGSFSSFAGNEQTEVIFSYFYNQPKELAYAFCKLKVMELMLYLLKIDSNESKAITEYQLDQIEIVREIHREMTKHMDQRFTIEEMAKKYLINPTTLKALFKEVYGNSIAAHIKEHRMEHAAKLLRTTDMSLAEIAKSVGYENQSKFTVAFKAYFDVLPKEYRKK